MIWKWIKHIRLLVKKCREDNIGAFASQTAFFLLLSLIPFFMVLSSLLKYTYVSEATLMRYVNGLVPEYIAPFVISIIHEVYNKSVGIVSITAIAGIWSAAKGIQHMAAGFNMIYGVNETRNLFVRRFWAVVYTLVFMASIVAALVLLVFGNSIQGVLSGYLPILALATEALFRLRGLIMLLGLSFVFTILFKTLPNNKAITGHKLTLKNQFPGAVLCAVFWYFISAGISVYLEYFNGFSMYGSLATIVLVMLWLYFGMYVMLFCAEINKMFGDKISRKMNLRKMIG